jgi:hypothetical protein
MSAPKIHLCIDRILQSRVVSSTATQKAVDQRTIGATGLLIHNTSSGSDLMYKALNSGSAQPTITSTSKTGRILPGDTVPLYFGDGIDLWCAGAPFVVEEF